MLRFTVLLLLCSFAAHAQLDIKYLPGTITLQDGSHVTGFIKNDVAAKMNYRIFFKSELTEKKHTTYDTTIVSLVELETGERYEHMQFHTLPENNEVQVLARVLLKGTASVYQLVYRGAAYYLVTKGEKTYVLRDDYIEKGRTEVTHFFYRNLLSLVTADSPDPAISIKKVAFTEKAIVKFVSDYNRSVNGANVIVETNQKPVHFIIAGVGGMKWKSDHELYFQGMYRTYFPKLSKGTSLNIGINYFSLYRKQYTGWIVYPNGIPTAETLKTHYDLVTIPFQLQQNFLNGNVRPFVFAGVNLCYISASNARSEQLYATGFMNNYGFHYLYGAGVEWSISKSIMLKYEYRFENLQHLLLGGVYYSLHLK